MTVPDRSSMPASEARDAIIQHSVELRHVKEGIARLEVTLADMLRGQEMLQTKLADLKVELALRDRLCGVHQTRLDELERQIKVNTLAITNINTSVDDVGNVQKLLALGAVAVSIIAAILARAVKSGP